MKRIIFVFAAAALAAMSLVSCNKESSALVGTTWSALEYMGSLPVAHNGLFFSDSKSAVLTRTSFLEGEGEETMTVSYTYNPPVLKLVSPYSTMTGTVADDTITFEGMDYDGKDLVFYKVE